MIFENTTDEEIITLWHKQAREMSFYNASEGESWYRERPLREHCRLMLAEIRAELQARNLEIPAGNYLI